MLSTILNSIAEDLENMHRLFDEKFSLIVNKIGDFSGSEDLSDSTELRPALMILSSRIYNGDPEKTTTLAVVILLMHMASKIQGAVSETEPVSLNSDSGSRTESRFFVLLGDYYYSLASSILLESGIKGMQPVLAEMAAQVNEGLVLKNKYHPDFNSTSEVLPDIVRKEIAEFFAGCALLGARLAEAAEEEQENMRCFGLNFGMVFGLSELCVSAEQIGYYANKARDYLLQIPDRPERLALEQLLDVLSRDNKADMRRLVV